jgi:hypothetical protein
MNKYELWLEPVTIRGNILPVRKLADIEGPDFNKAVELYITTVEAIKQPFWIFNEKDKVWTFADIRVHDNQQDAEAGKK